MSAAVNSVETPVSEGIQPKTGLDRIKQTYPNTGPIIADELRAEAEAEAEWRADESTMKDFRDREGQIGHELMLERESAKPSKKREAQHEEDLEAVRLEKIEYQRRREEERKNKPGYMMRQLRDWAASAASHRRYVPAGTTDELLPGLTPPEMAAKRREEFYLARKERTAISEARRTADEITASVAAEVKRRAANLSGTAARVDVDHERGSKVKLFDFEIPQVRVPNGLGHTTLVPDGFGLLCALFPEDVTERWSALILANHDEAKAIAHAERVRRLAEINAKLSDLQYKAEFWHRVARATGANPGPRIAGDNMLAVLDLRPAR